MVGSWCRSSSVAAPPACSPLPAWTGYCRPCSSACALPATSRSPWRPIRVPSSRPSSATTALSAVDMARRAGFDNLNLDLMHGLPGQSLAQARADIDQAIALGPEHLSWYQLTLEPNTVFYSRPPQLPEDEVLWDIQEAGQARLAEAGYAQYEISAYARSGRRARHNLNYWQYGDFIGIGAGAHGKLTQPDGTVERNWKTRQPKDYLNP